MNAELNGILENKTLGGNQMTELTNANPFTTLLLLGIVIVVLGIFMGLVEEWMRSPAKKKKGDI